MIAPEKSDRSHWLESIHQEWVATLDAIRDPIVVLSSSGTILRANKSFADLVEMEFRDLLQSKLSELVPWLPLERGHVTCHHTVTPDGRNLRIRSMPGKSHGDGQVLILEDITDSLNLEKLKKRHYQKSISSLVKVIETLLSVLAAKDPYTAQHSHRVSILSKKIALNLGLNEIQVQGVYYGAKLHDIGKLSIPSSILNKPGKLHEAEMNLIKIHCDIGQSLLKHIDFPWPVHNIIHQHHERLDGSGYPAGLVGDEIHLASRIVGVADVVEAITAHRPYRPALGIEVALEELTSGRGSRYDADVVDACHQVLGAGDEAFQESA